MTTIAQNGTGKAVWIRRAAMGAVGFGMLGIAACGSSSGSAHYRDGYHGGHGGAYYSDTYRSHHDRHDRRHDRDGYRDRGYYDRNGHWRRY